MLLVREALCISLLFYAVDDKLQAVCSKKFI